MYELLSHSKKFTKNINQHSMLSMSYLAIRYVINFINMSYLTIRHVINFINHVIFFYESDRRKEIWQITSHSVYHLLVFFFFFEKNHLLVLKVKTTTTQ